MTGYNRVRELRKLIETIPEMAWTAASDGAATFVNGRWSDYTGLSLEATLGFGWKFAVHSDDLERHVERIEDALKILEGWWKLIIVFHLFGGKGRCAGNGE